MKYYASNVASTMADYDLCIFVCFSDPLLGLLSHTHITHSTHSHLHMHSNIEECVETPQFMLWKLSGFVPHVEAKAEYLYLPKSEEVGHNQFALLSWNRTLIGSRTEHLIGTLRDISQTKCWMLSLHL